MKLTEKSPLTPPTNPHETTDTYLSSTFPAHTTQLNLIFSQIQKPPLISKKILYFCANINTHNTNQLQCYGFNNY